MERHSYLTFRGLTSAAVPLPLALDADFIIVHFGRLATLGSGKDGAGP